MDVKENEAFASQLAPRPRCASRSAGAEHIVPKRKAPLWLLLIRMFVFVGAIHESPAEIRKTKTGDS